MPAVPSAGVGALLALLITFQIAPIYTATTNVMIDPRKTNVVNLDAVVSGLNTDAAAVLSEIEILKSRALAEKVVRGRLSVRQTEQLACHGERRARIEHVQQDALHAGALAGFDAMTVVPGAGSDITCVDAGAAEGALAATCVMAE